jgi:hypothetical protein
MNLSQVVRDVVTGSSTLSRATTADNPRPVSTNDPGHCYMDACETRLRGMEHLCIQHVSRFKKTVKESLFSNPAPGERHRALSDLPTTPRGYRACSALRFISPPPARASNTFLFFDTFNHHLPVWASKFYY